MGLFTAWRESVYVPAVGDIPAAGTFSIPAARAMAWAAQVAYEAPDPGKLDRILGLWGWQRTGLLDRDLSRFLPVGGPRGFVAAAGESTIVAFAGTEPERIQDWVTNLTVGKSNAGVHDGFEQGVEAVWDRIEAASRAAKGAIVLVGHSLGGALAAVAAHRLIARRVVGLDSIAGVYTFGMPRTGNEAWADEYDGASGLGERTFRLVHGEDAVPMVPPAALLGFRHVGRRLACPRGGPFAGVPDPVGAEAPSLTELARAAALLVLPAEGGGPAWPAENPAVAAAVGVLARGVRDHLLDMYLRALGAAI